MIFFWLLACTNNKPIDTTITEIENPSFVLAMVALDYSVGSLAQFDLETQTLTEDIASISGDPIVVYDDGYIWQLNRYRYDTLRKYTPDNLGVPIGEISLRSSDEESSTAHSRIVVRM